MGSGVCAVRSGPTGGRRRVSRHNARADMEALTSSPERVVILDVDGVLHPFSSESGFTAPCMRALRSIVEQTGASIVLSSSWQGLPSTVAKVNAALEANGLPHIVAQTVTPNAAGYARTGSDAKSRAREISRWVQANTEMCAGGWIAIDDMHLQRLLPGGNFVRTEADIGLTDANAWSAVMMLGGPTCLPPPTHGTPRMSNESAAVPAAPEHSRKGSVLGVAVADSSSATGSGGDTSENSIE